MNTHQFTFIDQPRNGLYEKLIEYAQTKCQYFSLVVHPKVPLDEFGNQAIQKLSPCIYQMVDVSEWPGTRLLYITAKLYKYFLNPDSASTLKKYAQGLYDWLQPHLPEDLCFMIDEINPWLVSIAHENDGYLALSQVEYLELTKQIPEIRTLLKQD